MVYLIHFDEKLHHAQHYIGFVSKRSHKALERRYVEHLNSTGAKILRACNQAGIAYEISRIWYNGSRQLERQLKNKKHASRLCPHCSSKKNNT